MFILYVKYDKLNILREDKKNSGGNSGGVTPVTIPNTEVKSSSAYGTWMNVLGELVVAGNLLEEHR